MVEEKNESSRRLLDEIEGDWDAPKPVPVPGSPTEQRLHAALDAAADRLVESLAPPPISVPTMADLDSGWDEYDEEDEEEEEDEEPEPELPDERLDPVAYAAAKKAREEQMEARRQRRRAKAEAKKARRKARAEAARGKQKGKQKKARAPQKPARPAKKNRGASGAARPAREREDGDEASSEDPADDDADAGTEAPRSRAKLPPSRPMRATPMLSKTSTWMLGVAVVIFVAAAIFAAVVAR